MGVEIICKMTNRKWSKWGAYEEKKNEWLFVIAR
jgi:hypothetical protein